MNAASGAHVLWVTSEVPDRGGGGGNIRQSYLLEALASRYPTDLLVAGDLPDDDVGSVIQHVEQVRSSVREVPRVRLVRRLRDVKDALLPGGPIERRGSRAVRRRLAKVVAQRADYDLVCIEHAGLAGLANYRRPGERWAITLHNVGSLTADQTIRQTKGRVRWVWERERQAARRYEAKIMRDYDLVCAVSSEDASVIDDRVVVIPNGVDTDLFAFTPLPAEQSLIFTGTLSFRPNVEGLEWFCHDVLPSVRQAIPNLRFTVAGRAPTPGLAQLLKDSDVELVVAPPKIQPLLTAARVAVVPLHVGSGTRLKVLEAMAAGRPVVGTSVGLAGLGIEDGLQAVIRDDATAMAEMLIELLRSDDLASQLAVAGRRHVEDNYSWRTVADRYLAAISDLLRENVTP